ncbi:MAG: hypothetical protein IPO92_18630 [Saprospiraceae bacterium]|nr:hypothetical protein [Saprospiraceae bacterium]
MDVIRVSAQDGRQIHQPDTAVIHAFSQRRSAGPYLTNINTFVVTINIYDNTGPSPIIYYDIGMDQSLHLSSQSGLDGMTLNIAQTLLSK